MGFVTVLREDNDAVLISLSVGKWTREWVCVFCGASIFLWYGGGSLLAEAREGVNGTSNM